MLYVIKQGAHYPMGIHFGITTRPEIKFEGRFDSSCIYDLKSSDNYDVNKLFGFSTSWHHHWQSARFGWRCIDNKNIEILAYSYDKKQRLMPELMACIPPDQEFRGTIIKGKDSYKYILETGGKKKTIDVAISRSRFLFKYLLFPYFGGNRKAPHEMMLFLNKFR